MEHGQVDVVLRHRGRPYDLTIAVAGPSVGVGALLDALVPARAGVDVPADRHLRVGTESFDVEADLALDRLADGVELEVVDGPAPAPLRGPWPEAGVPDVAAAGSVAVHRSPRPALPPRPAPGALPEPPAPAPRRVPVLGLAALGPLLGAGVLVLATGDARFALVAALTPLTGAFAAVDQRRRSRGESRAEHRRFRSELDDAERGLAAAVDAEGRRLRALAPALDEVLDRARPGGEGLWQRVPGHPAFPDHLVLRLGTGDVGWDPPVVAPSRRCPEVAEAVEMASVLPRAPVVVDLGHGGVVGVVGRRTRALGIVRSLLLQAAVHHGPADVRLAICTEGGREHDWEWAKWLPHTRGDGRRLLAAGGDAVALLDHLAGGDQDGLLVVLDDPWLARGRSAPAAPLLGTGAGPAAVLVVAPTVAHLPACTSVVVDVGDAPPGATAEAVRTTPGTAEGCTFEPELLGADGALAAARRLARCRDPDTWGGAGSLPPSVSLTALLGLTEQTAEGVAARWAAGAGRPATPVGVGPAGAVTLDLVADGPHALVAGTTGSGKSELLRSLVVGLAASAPPQDLTFVLVDYKGGAAFDACARLPHTVGLVTDLDEGLAERALRSLEAELRHRELVLRSCGAASLDDHVAIGRPGGPLARLVVVVDEFATLKQEVPGFVDSLVSIAQRGRSLGVHLVLATQRPGGAVSDDIRANTDLRIALRVQDGVESTDVVGDPSAAGLPRERPGRALLRRGPGALVELQTAWASGSAATSLPPVWFAPLRFGPGSPLPGARTDASSESSASGLVALVDAITAAHGASGAPPPRRPWVEPLPPVLGVDQIGDGPMGELALGWVDLPDEQRRATAVWRPTAGGLLVVGSSGTGRTATLRAVAHAAARTSGPDACHVYGLDLGGGGGLGHLAQLPHCGDVVGPADGDRVVRLVRRLRHGLDVRRQAASGGHPRVLVLVDGLAALIAALPEVGPGCVDDLVRVLADGPPVGIHVAATADRPGAVPTAVAALLPQRLALHLADPLDAAALGAVVARTPRGAPGRAVDPATGLLVQLAWVSDDAIDQLAQGASPAGRTARPVGVLPARVPLEAVVHRSRAGAGFLSLAFALGDDDLEPASLDLRDGEHVLVAGPSRSGVSTALAALAAAGSAAGVEVVALVGARSGLGPLLPAGALAVPHAALPDLPAQLPDRGPWLLVVDDAHDLDDTDGVLAALLAGPPSGPVVVAGGRTDLLRGAYGHWTRVVRRSRSGLLLQPTPELDGELLGTRLARSTATAVPGRGVLVEAGVPAVVQVAGTMDP